MRLVEIVTNRSKVILLSCGLLLSALMAAGYVKVSTTERQAKEALARLYKLRSFSAGPHFSAFGARDAAQLFHDKGAATTFEVRSLSAKLDGYWSSTVDVSRREDSTEEVSGRGDRILRVASRQVIAEDRWPRQTS